MSSTLNFTELREGGSQDLTEVIRIMADAFDPRFGEAWTSAQCLGMLSLPGVWLVIASLDGQDVGFALARATLDEAELLLLASHGGARRGVAAAWPEHCCGRSSPRRRIGESSSSIWRYARETMPFGYTVAKVSRRSASAGTIIGERRGKRLTHIPMRASFDNFLCN